MIFFYVSMQYSFMVQYSLTELDPFHVYWYDFQYEIVIYNVICTKICTCANFFFKTYITWWLFALTYPLLGECTGDKWTPLTKNQ